MYLIPKFRYFCLQMYNPIKIELLKEEQEISYMPSDWVKTVIDWGFVTIAFSIDAETSKIEYNGTNYIIKRDIKYCFKQMSSYDKHRTFSYVFGSS